MSKVARSLEEAIRLAGLKSGMTVSYLHNLRGGDRISKRVIETIQKMGFKGIVLAPSSMNAYEEPTVAECMLDGTVRRLDSTALGYSVVSKLIQAGRLDEVCTMRTHGGRPQAIENGSMHIDIAFIYASQCDESGNCNGVGGKSAFGSMGYAMPDAQYADRVIVVTDHLQKDPVYPISIDQTHVDFVVEVDSLGILDELASDALRPTKDPVNLLIADYAAQIIKHAGYIKDGVSMQTGAGAISLAVATKIEQYMSEEQVCGRFAMGGITLPLTRMLDKGLFRVLYDVQDFDLESIRSLRERGRHIEVSASMYANPEARGGCIVNDLDCVVLGATEIDIDFNVNVHTDSNYNCISGAGGHGDTAEGAALTIVTAPAYRARSPILLDKVALVSTPGRCVDVFVCQRGIAVNTSAGNNFELKERLLDAGLPVFDIHDLKTMIHKYTGTPAPVKKGGKVVAEVMWRDGTIIDRLMTKAD